MQTKPPLSLLGVDLAALVSTLKSLSSDRAAWFWLLGPRAARLEGAQHAKTAAENGNLVFYCRL